jgi:hypothetical protein
MVVEIRAQPDSVNDNTLTVYRVDQHSRNVSKLVDPDQNDRGRAGGIFVTKNYCHNTYISQQIVPSKLQNTEDLGPMIFRKRAAPGHRNAQNGPPTAASSPPAMSKPRVAIFGTTARSLVHCKGVNPSAS